MEKDNNDMPWSLDADIEQMMEWLNVPTTTTKKMKTNDNEEDEKADLQQVILEAQQRGGLEQDEYTTAKHVTIEAIKGLEQMALIVNIYYKATTGAKMLQIVNLKNDPDAMQMHLEPGNF